MWRAKGCRYRAGNVFGRLISRRLTYVVKIADKFHEFSVYNLLYTNQVISTIETVHIVFFIIQFYWDFAHKNENVNRRISFINAFFTRFTEIFGDRKYLHVHSSVYGSLMTLWLAYLSLASHVVSALKMRMASMLVVVAHEAWLPWAAASLPVNLIVDAWQKHTHLLYLRWSSYSISVESYTSAENKTIHTKKQHKVLYMQICKMMACTSSFRVTSGSIEESNEFTSVKQAGNLNFIT